MADAFEAPDTAAQRTATLKAARTDAANVSYPAARGNGAPVDVRSALSVIDARIGGMQGSGVAGGRIDSIFSRYRGKLAASAKDLGDGVSARELSDFDRVLGVKQDISDDIGAAVRAGRNNEARELTTLRNALDQALEEASPRYRAANDEFATASRVIDQVDAGRRATSGRVRADDTVEQFGNLTPDQQGAFRSGYADPVVAKVENSPAGTNAARSLTSDKFPTEAAEIAVNPELLARRLGRENTMFDTGQKVLGGSRTTDNLTDVADSRGIGQNVLASLLQMRIRQAGTQALSAGANAAIGRNSEVREQLGQLLLSQGDEALQAVQGGAALRDGRAALRKLFMDRLIAGSAVAGGVSQ